jgi:thiamine-phosphate pyrophosphorylase
VAEYWAFGALFPSSTKETYYQEELELLEWWHEMVELPSVAIGGITPGNCRPLVDAGADFLAVSGAVWNGDEVAAVEAFAKAMAAAD